MEKRICNLLRREDGASAVEFALIAPVLLLFTIGIVEVSMMMLTQNVMESATFSASRLGKTGYAKDNMSREQTIREELETMGSGLLEPDLLFIDKLSYNEFGDAGSPEPFVDANGNGTRDAGENYTDVNENGQYDEDMGSAGAGSGGEVVVYKVTYKWHITTPLMSALIGENGVFNLVARAVVKNEPF